MSKPKSVEDLPKGDTPRPARLSTMLAVSALLGMSGGYSFGGPYRERSEPEEKPCINCGKMKRHNNDFCSGDCCKEYRQRSRLICKCDFTNPLEYCEKCAGHPVRKKLEQIERDQKHT